MNRLQHRSARAAWLWCLLYTLPVPPVARERRRGEIYSHLWEYEAAGGRSGRLVGATVRGVLDDVSWSLARGGPVVLAAPATWLGVAASLPVLTLAAAGVSDAIGNAVERTTAAAAALLLTGGPAWAAPASAGCVGQFFSEHAGIVPATGGELSVGSFVAPPLVSCALASGPPSAPARQPTGPTARGSPTPAGLSGDGRRTGPAQATDR